MANDEQNKPQSAEQESSETAPGAGKWSREAFEQGRSKGDPVTSESANESSKSSSESPSTSSAASGSNGQTQKERVFQVPPPAPPPEKSAHIEPVLKPEGAPKASRPRSKALLFVILGILAVLAACFVFRQPETPPVKVMDKLKAEEITKHLNEVNKQIEKDPKNPHLYYDRACIYFFDRDEGENSLKDLSKAIELDPKYYDAWALRASVASYVDEIDLAISSADKAILLAPYSPAAYSARAHVENTCEMYDKAIADCNKAFQLAPNDLGTLGELGGAYEATQQYDKAADIYTQQLKIQHPQEHPLTYSSRGMCRFHMQDFDGALDDFNIALMKKPDQGMFKLVRSFAEAALGDTTKAESDATAGVREENNPSRGKRLLADLYRFEGKFDQAIDSYNTSISLAPRADKNIRKRGVSFMYAGQLQNALTDLREAVRINPKSSRSLSYLALMEEMAGQKEAADRDMDKAFHATVPVSGVYSNRAIFNYKRGKLDEAVADAKQAIAMDQYNADAYHVMGEIDQAKGNTAEAHDNLDLAKKYFYPGSNPPIGW